MVIQAFRDNIPKWLTGIILVLIIGPFALWGINSYFSASGDTSVARVNGVEISSQDFQQAYQNRYQQMQQLMGSAFKPGLIDEKELRQEVLQQLINVTLLNQQAKKRGYSISNADLVTTVQQIPSFQVDGKFSSRVYQATLASNGLTPAAFEQRERQALTESQMQNAIEASAFATPVQLVTTQALQNEQRQISYATVTVKQFLKRVNISDAEISGYYKAHSNQFMTPEKVNLAYVELDQAQLAQNVTASDAQLQAVYQQQLASFKQEETREAQHILIAVNGTGAKADAAAKAKAEELLKQLKAGASFSKLAEKYSDDPGSSRQGGKLGWIGRGAMVKPFEDALFSIPKVGDVVGPIRTKYGYHIIKLDGIRAPTTEPFSKVRGQLLAEYQKKQAEDQYYALGDQLANLAYEHPNSLQAVSQKLKLPINTVDGVTPDSGTGIAANAAVREKAFSDEVLAQGNNSDPIKIGPNHVVVIRVTGHVPSEPESLSQVKDQIVSMLEKQQAEAQALITAKLAQAALASGKEAGQVAREYQLKFSAAKYITRKETGVPAQLIKAVFSMPIPAKGATETGSVQLADGDQAVYELLDVKPGMVSGNAKDQTSELEALSRVNANAEFASYLANLRLHAKVKVNTSNMQE